MSLRIPWRPKAPTTTGWFWVIGLFDRDVRCPAFVAEGLITGELQIMSGRSCYRLADVADGITHHAEMQWPEAPR